MKNLSKMKQTINKQFFLLLENLVQNQTNDY